MRGATTPTGGPRCRALPVLAAALALAACRDLASTGVSFGSYDPLSTVPLDSVGTITYDCPPPA